MNRIDQLLQQMIAETSHQVLPTVYSARMLAGLQELQGLTAAIEAQRAVAQQGVPAVPKGWQLVPVESTIEMEDAGRKAASGYMGLGEAGRIFRAMLAAAPAAPVAQELIGVYREDGEGFGFPEWKNGAPADGSLLYAAPPAAEQPDAWTPSGADYDRNIHRNPDAAAWADLFVATFPGLADKHDLMHGWFANAMMAMHDFLKAAQPDTVPVPMELLERIAIPVMLRWQEDAHADACAELRALLAGGAE